MLNGQRQITLDGIVKIHYLMIGEMMNYKFNEDKIWREIKDYIDSTYDQHYSQGKYQATDMIIDAGHGESFSIGNIMKYAMRCGKKDEKKKDANYRRGSINVCCGKCDSFVKKHQVRGIGGRDLDT